MQWPDDQVEELKQLSSDIEFAEEGGLSYFLIKNIQLPDGCTPSPTDVLLCPMSRDGYNSRLFFSEQIQTSHTPKAPLNWNGQNIRILEKNWFAYSWKTERSDLRLAQMVVEHISALR